MRWKRLALRIVLATLALPVSVAVVSRWLCGRDADPYFDGELPAQDPLARGVVRALADLPAGPIYHTGMSRFDGQATIATYQMAVLGLGQVALAHPEKRAEYLPAMRVAAAHLVDPATLEYAADVYGHHGIVTMRAGEGHAYLGYINLALGMLRAVDPETPYVELHDRLTRELATRLGAAEHGLIETYPGETWPPDVAAVAGSIGLHALVTGNDRRAFLDTWARRYAACAVDPSGYLVQRVRSGSCIAADAPRGSGTAIAAYFVSFADPTLSRRLYEALPREGRRSLFGFAALREYAAGHTGRGDTNAGFVVLGVSVGATGFGLGAARAQGDRELFGALYRTAHLFGMPVDFDGERRFVAGGRLGNALLLAMLTARQP